MKRRSFVAGAAAAALGAPAKATTGSGGATFTHDGGEFRLIDILAPKGGDSFAADSARLLQSILSLGRLDFVDVADPDRWNRRIVNVAVETSDGVRSVQELLIAEGGARVRPESEDRNAIGRLLSAEREARGAQRGLWRMPFYAVRDAAAHRATGAFHLVEGKVVTASIRKGRAYLNFGEDWRDDVTGTASSRDARRWAKEGLDWELLAGTRVRVRGYVASINGPSIEIVHPMQIEQLPA